MEKEIKKGLNIIKIGDYEISLIKKYWVVIGFRKKNALGEEDLTTKEFVEFVKQEALSNSSKIEILKTKFWLKKAEFFWKVWTDKIFVVFYNNYNWPIWKVEINEDFYDNLIKIVNNSTVEKVRFWISFLIKDILDYINITPYNPSTYFNIQLWSTKF